EIEISTEKFVTALAGQHHFNTHGLDNPCQKIHWCRCSYSGNVIGFQMVNDITDGIQAFLNSEMNLVMYGTDVLCSFLRSYQIGRSFQTDCKTVQTRIPRLLLIATFNTVSCILGCYCCDNGRVQSATKQNAIGYITHQLAVYRCFQTFPYFTDIRYIIFHTVIFFPITVIPFLHFKTFGTKQEMTRQKNFYGFANSLQSLQLRSDIVISIAVPALIQRTNSHMVPPYEIYPICRIIECEGKYAVQFFQKILAVTTVKCQNNFAVGLCEELIVRKFCTQLPVVIYFAVYSQDYLAVFGKKRLFTGCRVYDGQTFMGEDYIFVLKNTAPVRTAVPDFSGHL